MSNKKSLGSSPIGYRTQGTMSFIPDLGVSKSKKRDSIPQREAEKTIPKKVSEQENPSQKKTVSYYLEEDLIEQIKSIASQKDMCYSALVSNALERWIVENG